MSDDNVPPSRGSNPSNGDPLDSAPSNSDPSNSDPSNSDPPDSMEEVLNEALAEESRPSLDGVTSLDEVDIRDALREAMKPVPDRISLTEKVQRKIREDPELDGRFFADGWSTVKSPKETYLVTSLVMLVVVIVVYLLIKPYGL